MDQKQQTQGLLFVSGVIFQAIEYMTAAFRWANQQAGVPDGVFWRNLFLPTQKDPLEARRDGWDPERCPDQPYAKLDFQACVKYLLYGGERRLPPPETGYAEDSVNVLRAFGLGTRALPRGGTQPVRPYLGVLHTALSLRNANFHGNVDTIKNVTLESLEGDLKKLEDLLAPFARKEGWLGDLQPLPAFWKETWEAFRGSFGSPPVSLAELGQEIFLSEEAALSPGQMQALERAAEQAGLVCRDGKVYPQGEDWPAVKRMLTQAPAVAALLGVRAGGGAAAPQAGQAGTGVLAAVPAGPAALLRRCGAALPQQRAVLSALLDHFTVLVDESIFLAQEGRDFLNQRLAPLLNERREKLRVDESVVNTLFKSFRGSAPYRPLELSELALTGLTPDQIEDMQAQRRDEHRTAKNAVKALRYLRQRGCLEVLFSPADSTHSYDNLPCLADRFPAVRFLVLTMDRQLAEELKSRPNAVAAKPELDAQNLRLYRASKPAWSAMLEGRVDAPAPVRSAVSAPAPVPPKPKAPEPPAEVLRVPDGAKKVLSIRELPGTGSAVTAVWPDGTRREFRLGRPLGKAGGEGVVYTLGGSQPLAVKIYHRNQLTQERREKLRHMVRVNPDIQGLCWPQALVFNGSGEWAGFLMPRVENGRELCQTVYKPGRDNRTLKALNWDRTSLARIAANMAGTFARMHQRGILMGDVNPRNFMVGADCGVYFVDCDSYQFEGFPCPVRSDRYTPPEILRAVKRAGQESYNYIRTLDHERYSMAVVLFEILMLGKSPYESRNTDSENVLEAIMDGNFPYPFRAAGDDGTARRTDQAPAGRWREIWSHMTYQVKAGFHGTFTGSARQSAGDWERILREYIRQIELGHSSSALFPEGFKDIDNTMLNKTCSQCGTPYTIDEETYQRRSARHEADLCPTHYIMFHNFRNRKRRDVCAQCGAEIEVPVSVWLDRRQRGRDILCPACFARARG